MTILELFSSKSGDFVAYFPQKSFVWVATDFFWGHQVLKYAPSPFPKEPGFDYLNQVSKLLCVNAFARWCKSSLGNFLVYLEAILYLWKYPLENKRECTPPIYEGEALVPILLSSIFFEQKFAIYQLECWAGES